MAIRLLRGALNVLRWALCAVGGVALVLAAMIATPLQRPPEMKSVSDSVKAVDFSTMPPLERFGPCQLGTFWPLYFMLFYTLAGLWFGHAFVAIGLDISALTLIGFFYIGEAFPLWMAFVNGGGLILGGLWMRRI
jgi:hypothetical protein